MLTVRHGDDGSWPLWMGETPCDVDDKKRGYCPPETDIDTTVRVLLYKGALFLFLQYFI